MNLDWHPQSLRDIEEILDHVAARSLTGAQNVSASIERAAQHCAHVPFSGSRTNRANVFRWPLTDRRMTIFYRVYPGEDRVEILRVFRSGRLKNLRRLPRA